MLVHVSPIYDVEFWDCFSLWLSTLAGLRLWLILAFPFWLWPGLFAEAVFNLLHEPGLGPHLQLPVGCPFGLLADLPVFPGSCAVTSWERHFRLLFVFDNSLFFTYTSGSSGSCLFPATYWPPRCGRCWPPPTRCEWSYSAPHRACLTLCAMPGLSPTPVWCPGGILFLSWLCWGWPPASSPCRIPPLWSRFPLWFCHIWAIAWWIFIWGIWMLIHPPPLLWTLLKISLCKFLASSDYTCPHNYGEGVARLRHQGWNPLQDQTLSFTYHNFSSSLESQPSKVCKPEPNLEQI